MVCFEKFKEGLEARGFVQSQLYPWVFHIEEMVPLFYVYYFLMFSPSKEKTDDLYASLQEYFKIKGDEELNKYIGIEKDRRPDLLIYIRQPYTTQRIINMIPGMDKSNANPTPATNPPLEKLGVANEKKMTLITYQ